MMKKTLAAILACVLFVSMFAACGGGTTPETPGPDVAPGPSSEDNPVISEGNQDADASTEASDETLRIALTGEPNSLLTCIATGTVADPVNYMIYDGLVWFNSATGEIEPRLATSWENLDELTWRFHLRDDVVAHDGSKFTAEDVLYNFQCGQESGLSFYASNFDLANCKVVDEYTIDLVTKKFIADVPSLMSCGAFMMTSKAGVELAGGTEAAMINPLGGTGPYKFVSWETGSSIKLERNEAYWGQPAYYKYVEFSFINDDTTRLMALQSGDVNAVAKIAVSQIAAAKADSNMTMWAESTLGAHMLSFNCDHEALSDVRVRQAIVSAIDRDALFQVAMKGYGEMTDINLSTLNLAYNAPAGDIITYDVERAKNLMKEAGYENGLTLRLQYMVNPIFETLSEMIISYLSEIGITVIVESKDNLSFVGANKEGDYDMELGTASAYTLNRAIDGLYGNGGHTTAGWWAWRNAEFDAIVDSLGTESDLAKRGEILAPAYELVRQEVPLLGLFNDVAFCATDSDITGVSTNIQGTCLFTNAAKIAG